MKLHILVAVTMLSLAVLCSGCVAVDLGPDGLAVSEPLPNPGKVNVKPGVTQAKSVWLWFGSPEYIECKGEKTTWIYTHNDILGKNSKLQKFVQKHPSYAKIEGQKKSIRLTLMFDAQGILKSSSLTP